MKTIPFLEDLLFGSEILFCPRGIINKPTVIWLYSISNELLVVFYLQCNAINSITETVPESAEADCVGKYCFTPFSFLFRLLSTLKLSSS